MKYSSQQAHVKKLKQFRGIILGGESSESDMQQKCLKHKLRVFISYGMTETTSGVCGFWIDQYPSKLKSVGQPFKDVEISIKNKCVMINSKINSASYYMGSSISDNFLSSDIGEVKENFLYIRGNRNSVVSSGGEKINLDYVEAILLKHESISHVSINSVKSKKWGNSIHVKLTLLKSDVSVCDIKEWCRHELPSYSIPHIEIVT